MALIDDASEPSATARTPSEVTIPEALGYAVTLHKSGHLDAAASLYERILVVAPNHPDALAFFGVCEHQRGRTLRGLELLDRAIAIAPEHADAHNNRGNLLRQLDRAPEAEQAYVGALNLRPDDPDMLNNLGAARKDQRDFLGAIALYQRAIALNPEHSGAYHNLGNALSTLDRHDEALDAYQAALRLRPYDGESHRLLGAGLYSLDRIADAAEVYRKWMALEPNHPVAAHMFAACAADKVSPPPRASDAFVRATFDGFAPSFDRVLANLDYQAPALVGQAVIDLYGEGHADLDVLDIGCGTGLCGPYLRPYARQLVGVDLSDRMLSIASERRAYDALHAAELTGYLAASSDGVDLVVSADTLCYFGELGEVFAACARVLRPRGALVFTVEQHDDVEGAISGFRIHPHGRYSHSAAYIHDALTRQGFATPHSASVALRREGKGRVKGLLVTAVRP